MKIYDFHENHEIATNIMSCLQSMFSINEITYISYMFILIFVHIFRIY